MSAPKQIVKKRREAKEASLDSDEDDDAWFEDASRALSPGADSGGGRKRSYKQYWSQLLGCMVQSERKKKKPKIVMMAEMFGMFLKADGIDKDERLKLMQIVITLLRQEPKVRTKAPIVESVRHRVALERRLLLFGDDATEAIQNLKKKNVAHLQLVTVELDVTKEFMKGVDDREKRRRKREQLKEAAAKMGMTLEDLEAARAKSRPLKEEKNKKQGKSAGSPHRRGATNASPLIANDGIILPGAGGLESPTNPILSSSTRLDTLHTTTKCYLQEDRFFHKQTKNLDQIRKVNTKVLTILGVEDSKGEKDFTGNTAEEDLEMRSRLALHMQVVAGYVHDAAELDSSLGKRLKYRKQVETAYSYLLDYLDTLPPFDKDGKPMSVASLKDFAKMQRHQANQLAINRIQLRFGMERPIASNDAFLGKLELMRVTALLRTVMYVKAWMLLYKHAETSRHMRAVGNKIGFNSVNSLQQKTLFAMRDNVLLNAEIRLKLKDATKFLLGSVNIRNECFRLWVHAHRLDKHVGATRFKTLANGMHALKEKILGEWHRVVMNKKRAMARWTNGTLLWALREWSDMVHSVQDFDGMLEGKLGGRMLAQGKVLKGMIFKEWIDLARKKKKALKRWTHSALVHIFQVWAGLCSEGWALYTEVHEKCKGVAARLTGTWRDMCFHAWSSAVLKDRRARARFANSTLYMCLSSWKGLARKEKRLRQVLSNICMRIERRSEILVFRCYADLVAECVHMKTVLEKILQLWVDKGRRAGFRCLYMYADRQKVRHKIIADSLLRLALFRQRMGILGLSINHSQKVRVRVVLARIRMRPAAAALELWHKVVMDVIYATPCALADKSPMIARFLKRAMVDAFYVWHTAVEDALRHRHIIKSIRTRVVYGAAIAALQNWAVFIEDRHVHRHDEVVQCVTTALRTADLSSLQQVLARHFQIPHVRRRFGKQSMRDVVAQVLAEGGASYDTVSLLSAEALHHLSHPPASFTSSGAWGGVLRDEQQSMAHYNALEARTHLQTAFAKTMSRSVDSHKHGGVTWTEPPPRPATLKHDPMGDLLEAHHAALHRSGGLQLLSKAQRLDTGTSDTLPAHSRLVSATAHGGGAARVAGQTGGHESRSHADATQWVLGVMPSLQLVNKMGVGRLHADAFYASSLPVPVTDLNCTSMEVKLGACHRIWDSHGPLPARVFRKSHSSHPASPPDDSADLSEQHMRSEGRSMARSKQIKSALGAADLVHFKDDSYFADGR